MVFGRMKDPTATTTKIHGRRPWERYMLGRPYKESNRTPLFLGPEVL